MSAPTYPNAYAILGDDKDTPPAPAAVETPPDPTPTDKNHGWDSFIGCLDNTTKGEMGVVDPILVNYVNFVGDELRAFHVESNQLMTRLKKLDEDMAQDHDAIGKLNPSLEFL